MLKKRLYDIFYCHQSPGRLWFRAFRHYGLSFKDTRRHGFAFSERYGNTRFRMIGPWLVTALNRDTHRV